MRSLSTRTLAAAVAVPLMLASVAPVTAQVARPLSAQASSVADDAITPVRWRGRGAAIGAGIAAGLLLGGALAARPYYYGYGAPYPYYAPAPVYVDPPVYDEEVAYCARRYRSYDPASGTYLGYDGYRHPCP
jgi:hypothetical protein